MGLKALVGLLLSACVNEGIRLAALGCIACLAALLGVLVVGGVAGWAATALQGRRQKGS